MKLRKCRQCSERRPVEEGVITPLAFFCCHACAIQFAKEKSDKARKLQLAKSRRRLDAQAKEVRKAERQRKMDVKPLSYWMKRAQMAFNAFIRARDEGLPCVSCGRPEAEVEAAQGWKTGGAWDCGHFLSVGSHPALRYTETNAARQCKSCNGGAGNFTRKNWQTASDYREELIRRIGIDQVEWLEGPHEPKRYRKEDYQQIEAEYKAKLSELKKSKAA